MLTVLVSQRILVPAGLAVSLLKVCLRAQQIEKPANRFVPCNVGYVLL